MQRFDKVNYYSVSINEDDSLFRQFVVQHTIDNKEKLNHIMAWIKVIGSKTGAHEQYFRNEAETADTRGLPPVGINRDPVYAETDDEGNQQNTNNNLRLYCMRLNEHVVFLFNGGLKTAETAQQCANVRPHFRLANQLTKLIDKGILDKDIKWNEDCTDISIEEDFCLMW